MCKCIECKENENLSYDEMCDRCSLADDDYFEENKVNQYFTKPIKDNQYTKEEIEISIKECLSNLISELKNTIQETFNNVQLQVFYNNHIDNWNEIIASIFVNNNVIELKLTNEYINNINYDFSTVYVTLFTNGKGIYTECLERISEEYEFTGVNYVPINENELCFKDINKDNFIQKIILQISRFIKK